MPLILLTFAADPLLFNLTVTSHLPEQDCSGRVAKGTSVSLHFEGYVLGKTGGKGDKFESSRERGVLFDLMLEDAPSHLEYKDAQTGKMVTTANWADSLVVSRR